MLEPGGPKRAWERNPGQDATPHPQSVVAVASGKGGVGKTHFCVNFALGLMQHHIRPIVIDADVGFADVEVMLGVRPKRTLVDVLEGLSVLEAIEYAPGGLPFLSAGSGLVDLHDLTGDQMARLVGQVSLLQERFDIVLMDCGSGMGPNFERLLSAVDDLIVITTPEPTALADAYALLKLLTLRGALPPVRLVVNRAESFVQGRLTAEKLRLVADRFLDAPVGVLGYVLEDDAVPHAVMQQTALMTAFPQSAAARCYQQLVHNYLRIDPAPQRGGLSGFLIRVWERLRHGQEETGHSA
ncbi:MinD/ParA family protein [Alicyclobacillus macrosporangiidus]|uniref:MinD/ParA family protein n=1 Tax=Alicyclobacillus macrosporangiidus TaxID=392015 RepID=UPI00068CD2A8|nr:MinD/ParA family protein [Alicyclobacillus macrosporangiidus]